MDTHCLHLNQTSFKNELAGIYAPRQLQTQAADGALSPGCTLKPTTRIQSTLKISDFRLFLVVLAVLSATPNEATTQTWAFRPDEPTYIGNISAAFDRKPRANLPNWQ